ncbi:MAG: glycosyl hydrolase [Opitutales bacterium]
MKITLFKTYILSALISVPLVGYLDASQDFPSQSLENAFASPPDSAKPWVYWWWLNGRASKEGITKDFEEMKEKGISGALLFDAQTGGTGVPDGTVFMSPEWRELFKFSVKEADRLGITLTANMTRGWNAGGPWVTPEHGIKRFAYSEGRAQGPKMVEMHLPSPASKKRLYRDVAVLACRVDKTEASDTDIWPFEQIVDLTHLMDAEGRLVWDAPAGDWSILRMGYFANGKKVAKNSGTSSGLEIDPMSAEAMDVHFAETGAKMIEDAGELAGKTFQYLHIDSWEIQQPDWTPKMPEEFSKRRGYDMTKWLPALCGRQVGSVADTEAFLQDFRVTVCDLIAENYYGRLDVLARQYGLLGTHSEAGGPIGGHKFWLDGLKFHGVTAIPMGEFWVKRFEKGDVTYGRNHTIKQIASAAHIYGKEICQAEAYTSTADLFTSDPYKIKAAGDLAFCDGLTRMVFHQWIHQPELEMVPGLWSRARKGKVDIGTKFGHTQTWWPMAEGFLDYLSRCQYLLRQGKFVADFAYLLNERIPSYVVTRDQMNPLCPPGYDYDALNAEVLLNLASAEDGQLLLASGMRYRYLVLPQGPDVILSAETRNKIEELSAAGVQVIGPGYREGSLEEITRADGLVPDIEFRDSSPNAHFEKIHRRDGEVEIYFISNQSLEEVSTNAAFRVSGKQPELWDPVTGEIRDLPEWTEDGGQTVVPMLFAPKQSSFVVFRMQAQASEGQGVKNFPESVAIQSLAGPWHVAFDPKWGGPESIVFDELVDWTERPEDGIRYYSGRANYRKTFDLPDSISKGEHITLDLGKISCIARVTLNGKDLGVVWTVPWRVDLTDAIQAKGNILEIEVANHWINRIIGDEKLPDSERFAQTNVVSKGTSLQPAGLIGPVNLFSATNND